LHRYNEEGDTRAVGTTKVFQFDTDSILAVAMMLALSALMLKLMQLQGNSSWGLSSTLDRYFLKAAQLCGITDKFHQVCTATKRLLVHKDIYPQMLKALSKANSHLKVGGPKEEGVVIGPLQNKMQFEKLKGVYKEVEEGHFAVEKGQEVSSKGFFLQPTIIDDPPKESLIYADEQMAS
jgi:hypothetical protein